MGRTGGVPEPTAPCTPSPLGRLGEPTEWEGIQSSDGSDSGASQYCFP